MDRWKEHLESLFQEVKDVSEQPDLEIGQESDKEISEEEVQEQWAGWKVEKHQARVASCQKCWRRGEKWLWLAKLFNEVWGRGVAPRDWKSAIIVPIHKKGSRLECTNYRGISLLSLVGKVFARVLNDRVKGLTEGSNGWARRF